MLQGLWVFPMCEADAAALPERVRRLCGMKVSHPAEAGTAKHVFTHQVWLMSIYTMEAANAETPSGWRFVTLDEMEQLAIPSAMRGPLAAAKAILNGIK